MAQPSTAASSGGTREGTATSARSSTMICSPSAPIPAICATGVPSSSSRARSFPAQRGRGIGAQVLLAGPAPPARPAGHHEAGDHGRADGHRRHVGADGFDDAGRLVPEDDGPRPDEGAVDDVQVAVAQPDGLGAHDHLTPPRTVDGQVRHHEVVTTVDEAGSPHGPIA